MYIRTRLALWFMLILAVVLVTFSVSIYNLTHDSLLAQAKGDVRNLAGALVTAGALLITLEHQRVKRVERRWLAEHPDRSPHLRAG